MTMDIKIFYLNTLLKRYKYLHLKLADIPPDVIEQCVLHEKATDDGWVYVKICKGMYGLPQAGLLAQEQLEKQLAHNGYHQSKHTHGL